SRLDSTLNATSPPRISRIQAVAKGSAAMRRRGYRMGDGDSGSPMGRDLLQLLAQRTLGEPEVVGLLQPEPDSCPVATELSEPHRHLGRNSRALRENSMERLARHPQLAGRLGDRQAERGQDVLPQDGTRVGRRTAGTTLDFQLSRHLLLLAPSDSNPIVVPFFGMTLKAPDPGDWLDPEDRAALHRALAASQEDVEAGRHRCRRSAPRTAGVGSFACPTRGNYVESAQLTLAVEATVNSTRSARHVRARASESHRVPGAERSTGAAGRPVSFHQERDPPQGDRALRRRHRSQRAETADRSLRPESPDGHRDRRALT